jgi:hypothetical protein
LSGWLESVRRSSPRSSGGRDPLRDGYFLAAVGFLVAIALGLLPHSGADTHIYWANGLPDPYSIRDYAAGNGFFYSPAFAQLFSPLRLLPFVWVNVLWTAGLLTLLYWLVGRWSVIWLLFIPVAIEIYFGNVALMYAAIAVVGDTFPWAWSFVLLTKVTPGVGLIWFAVRREWARLGVALAATVGIVAASFLLAPGLWSSWVALLQSNDGSDTGLPIGPLWLRLPLAAILVAWGARTNRRWVLPVGMLLGSPRLWVASFAVLTALPRLLRPAAARQVPVLDQPIPPVAEAPPARS